jgi:hypothetical protein
MKNSWPSAMTGMNRGNCFVAVFISRSLTVSGVRFGSFCSIKATVPLTTGVAIDVPLRR